MDLNDIAKDIASGIGECPDFIAIKQVMKSARELCQKARVWREACQIKASGSIVQVPTPAGSDLAGVIRVVANGRELSPGMVSLDGMLKTGLPEEFFLDTGRSLNIVPAPREAQDLAIIAYMMPTGVSMPAGLLMDNDVYMGIRVGALHYLHASPDKAWYSPDLSQYYLQQFGSIVASLRTRFDKGRVGASRRTKPRFM